MCKPISEGGQRCAAHTRPAYRASEPGTHEWDEAAAQHAATPTGRKEVEADRAAADRRGDQHTVAALTHALRRGADLRQQAAAVKAALDSVYRDGYRDGWDHNARGFNSNTRRLVEAEDAGVDPADFKWWVE